VTLPKLSENGPVRRRSIIVSLQVLLAAFTLSAAMADPSAQGVVAGPPLVQPAGGAVGPAPPSRAALEQEIEDADRALREISRSFGATTLTDGQIAARSAAIGPIQAKIADALANLGPRLDNVDARLAQLGPGPSAGQPPEATEIAQNRRSLVRAHQTLDADVKQAKLLKVEADQLASNLAKRRRQQLQAQLWTKSPSILDPSLWRASAQALPEDGARVATLLDDEGATLAKAARSRGTLILWIAALVAAIAAAGPLRLLVSRILLRRMETLSGPGRAARTLFALGRVSIATVSPLLAVEIISGSAATTGAITPLFEQLAPVVVRVVVFACFFEGLGQALLSPRHPRWRLAPIPQQMVLRLAPFPGLIGATAAAATFISEVSAILSATPATAVACDAVAVLVEVAVVGAALGTLGRARNEHLATVAPAAPVEAESRLPWVLAALLAWMTVAASVVAVLFGYVEMASKLTVEMIWVATVLGSLFLLMRAVDDLTPAAFSPHTSLGRFLQIAIGLSQRALEQLSVLVAGVIRLALFLLAWAAILAPFGSGLGDVFGRVTSSDLIVHIGQVSISPGAVVGSILVFVLGLVVTRAVRGWLEKSYLPKTRMDVGLRTSLASGVSYLGALAAVLLSFGYLGLSFDRIALFASALSVGVGFGLQSVIGNFVSGLVLLAERPIKVGDWIAIGDLEGDVKRINVRATEIEMADRSKLIVPNSDLISKTVRNVTHSGSLGRVKIVLKVDDDADPELVKTLIQERVAAHEGVRREPAPSVYLTNVADGALEFSAFAYVDTPRMVYSVRSELLFRILPDLRVHNIKLASLRQVVTVSLADRAIEPPA